MAKRSMRVSNTNKLVTLYEVFRAFGFQDEDDILFRLFEDDEDKKNTPAGLFWSEKAGKTTGRNIPIKLSKLDGCLQEIDRLNQEYTAGVFFVVNGGGNSDSEVLQAGRARAQFFEIDDRSFEEQEKIIRKLPLPPSLIVKTKKSYHAYYLLRDGDISRFRAIQSILAEYVGGDQQVKNESRVMRVPSFYHNKAGRVMVQLQHFDPDTKYTQDELVEAFRSDEVEVKPKAHFMLPDRITDGTRNQTLFRLASLLQAKGLSDEAIKAAVMAENLAKGDPALPEKDIDTIVNSALRYDKGISIV